MRVVVVVVVVKVCLVVVVVIFRGGGGGGGGDRGVCVLVWLLISMRARVSVCALLCVF